MIKDYVFEIATNFENEIFNENSVDESNFKSPHGCSAGTISKKLLKRIEIRNNTSNIIKNVYPVMNDKDLRSIESILSYLGVKSNSLKDCLKVYYFIYNNIFHAVSGFQEMYDSVKMLNWWGYCICGHNANALKEIFSKLGVDSRRIKLNGHSVNEFKICTKTMVLDADVKIHYLALDNVNLCSFEELIKDPFLIYRTKPYGIYQQPTIDRSFTNMSLFEYIENKVTAFSKSQSIDSHMNGWDLYPNESLLIDYDLIPENPLNKDKIYSPSKQVIDNSLVTIIHKLDLKSRKQKQLFSSFPIYKIENKTKNEVVLLPSDKIITSLSFDNVDINDEVFINYQISLLSMPELLKGINKFEVKSDNNSSLEISLRIDEERFDLKHKPQIINKSNIFEYENPYFDIFTQESIQKLWWQISNDKDFCTLIPSFNNIENFKEKIIISDLETTFFNNQTDYYFRCKAEKSNIWSDWSETFSFKQIKPNQPFVSYKVLDNNQIEFKIENYCSEEEYLIFGDDRLDFIPEIYTKYKCISYSNFNNLCFDLNKNHLFSSREKNIIIDKKFPFYRIMSKKGYTYSVPSKIIQFDDLLDQAHVLQCRTYYANEERKKQKHVNYEGRLLSLQ